MSTLERWSPLGRLLVGIALVAALTLGGCRREGAPVRDDSARPAGPVTISVLGTNDLHGRVERVAVLSGYVGNLRERRRVDGGRVVLVDAGDMFQGTLVSNLGEGAAAVKAYNHVGYDAAAIGNHEFDYGPEGPLATPKSGEDPRGALKARAREARFPFLAANIVEESTGTLVAWENVKPTHLVKAGEVEIGLIGVTTETTPRTTLASNFVGLKVLPPSEAVAEHAHALREQGADVVVVLAHVGGRCQAHDDPRDLSSCQLDEEVFRMARALPEGLVDVIVAGHTHAAVAHEVAGIAIIESYANGTAFGRVDLVVDPEAGQVLERSIFSPRSLCEPWEAPVEACNPGSYEGAPVEVDHEVLRLLGSDLERAQAFRDRPVGVVLKAAVTRAYAEESPLGNLFADLMRAARPEADVAITNGGGLRADLPAGPLTYGALFEAMPFDNRFALLTLKGSELARVLEHNLARQKGGILSVSGVRAEARCEEGALRVQLFREDGQPVRDDEILKVATSDFLAADGDGAFGVLEVSSSALLLEEGLAIREAMAEALKARGGELDPAAFFDEGKRRLVYPGKRPVRCP